MCRGLESGIVDDAKSSPVFRTTDAKSKLESGGTTRSQSRKWNTGHKLGFFVLRRETTSVRESGAAGKYM